ncbi:alpha/beta hydrolase [Flavobacterium sp.]|uniref:alpha/beta hydrolase n=1 Tax=Flavobacterium sp. TaxID=239 RepID=UPI0039E3CE6A
MRALRFVLVSLGIFFGIVYVLFLAYAYFNQESMIFFPSKLNKDYPFHFEQPFEEMTIVAPDNTKLNGLLFTTPHSKGLVFYLHGNAGALDTWGDIAPIYTGLGYDIFILDYRGFGKSDGTIESEKQFFADVSAAYRQLTRRYPENQTIVIGYSIGSGLAAYLASQNHPATLILQAPYYSLTELADTRIPFIPDFLKKYHFETHEFIQKAKCPIYIFHGDADQVIAYDNSVRLRKLLKPGDRFLTLKGQPHQSVNDNPEFQSELKIILDTLALQKTTP